ncbi:MAG: DUF4446 family protein [Bacillota bacterium]
MSAWLGYIDQDPTPWLLGLFVLVGVLGILVLIQLIQLASLRRRYNAIWRSSKALDLEALLTDQARRVDEATNRVRQLDGRCASLEEQGRRHVQHVGVVRFNAFADTGSDLSFAVALLDEEQNGVVISSLYGRDESRVYAKPVTAGQSSYFLTNEEKEALAKALGDEGHRQVAATK